MLLSYNWMDGWVGLGSLCGAIVRASLRDANNGKGVLPLLNGGNARI